MLAEMSTFADGNCMRIAFYPPSIAPGYGAD